MYSEQAATIENVTEREEATFLTRVYNLDLAKSIGESVKLYQGINLYQAYRCGADENDVNLEGFMFDVIENTHEKMTIWVKMIHRNFENLAMLPPYEGTDYEVEVGPGDHAIVTKKLVDLQEGFDFSLAIRKRVYEKA